jgi:hypothetical protein
MTKEKEQEKGGTSEQKPIEIEEKDLEQTTGGTAVQPVVEDPCAGGRVRKQ